MIAARVTKLKLFISTFFPFFIPSVGQGSSDSYSDGIVKLVASLSMQVCRMNPPFCKDLHGRSQSSQEPQNPSVLKMREEMLQVNVILNVGLELKAAKFNYQYQLYNPSLNIFT